MPSSPSSSQIALVLLASAFLLWWAVSTRSKKKKDSENFAPYGYRGYSYSRKKNPYYGSYEEDDEKLQYGSPMFDFKTPDCEMCLLSNAYCTNGLVPCLDCDQVCKTG